jgi:hypothetical protein
MVPLRTQSRRLLRHAITLALAACGGSELTLPNDTSPANLQAASGYGQEGTVGKMLDDPLVARLTDRAGRPLAGMSIRFESDVVGEIDPATATTNEDGRASARVRLGTTEGTQTIEARLNQTDSGLRATFDVRALSRGKGHDNDDKGHGGGGGGGGDDDNDDDDDDDDEEEDDD